MINPFLFSHKIKLFWVNIFTKWVQSKNQNIQEMKIKTKETEDKIEITIYKTKDGKEFKSELDATQHEAKILSHEDFEKRFHLREIMLSDGRHKVIYIKNNDLLVLEQISNYFGIIPHGLLKGINIVTEDYSGDYRNVDCEPLEEVLKEQEDNVKVLKDVLEVYKDLEGK